MNNAVANLLIDEVTSRVTALGSKSDIDFVTTCKEIEKLFDGMESLNKSDFEGSLYAWEKLTEARRHVRAACGLDADGHPRDQHLSWLRGALRSLKIEWENRLDKSEVSG